MQNLSDATAYGLRRHLARLFGVRQVSDIHERLCELRLRAPLGPQKKARLAVIRQAGILFVHMPKNAGTSICAALYGRDIKHGTIRYYRAVAPQLVDALPSFAVIRDPVDRFLSAFAFARSGGTRDKPISLAHRAGCMALGSIDAALDHVAAARSPYALDHIFRPQSWYVTDAAGGLAVDRLLAFEAIGQGLAVPGLPSFALPRLNRGDACKPAITERQIARLRQLYARDFDLFEAVRGRGDAAPHPLRARRWDALLPTG